MATKVDFTPFENLFAVPLRNGLTRPKAVRGKGIKMINMGELFAHSRINNVETDRVPFSDNENSFLLNPGDLLFARQSLVLAGAGKCSIFVGDDEEVTYEGHIIRARINSKIADPFFYYYFFNSPVGRQTIESIVEQVAAAGIRGSDLAKLNVPCPPLPEQNAIAGILGALDDKVELNRRMNATLESMARAVFVERMKDENRRMKGWEEKPLDEIANFLNGLALQKFPAEGDDYLPVIKISQLRKNDTEGADKASANIPPEYIIEDGDILFSWSGSLEVVVWCGGKGALNQHLFKVTSEQYPKWFYYLWTKHHLTDFQEIAAGKATTMGHIQRHHLKEAKVLVPSDKDLQEMDKVMSPLLDKIINNNLESRTLASLRDGLLPRLMRGEVRVKSAYNLAPHRAKVFEKEWKQYWGKG